MKINSTVWLIGCGPMAVEYAKVLKTLEVGFLVIGRGENSAAEFESKTGIAVLKGGLAANIKNLQQVPKYAIVSVGVEQLADMGKTLVMHGVKKLLIEKPAGLTAEEIIDLSKTAEDRNAEVSVGYNRRFYSSVLKAMEIMQEDGGAISFSFEFTEWAHVIEKLDKPAQVKRKWFLSNSTHVVDLAYYMCGIPEKINCYTSGSLGWHPDASIFAGSGISKQRALFSYQANWQAPGRWGVEVLTGRHRIILRPLEEVWLQRKGSVTAEKVEIDDHLDKVFKPGLYRQTEAFLRSDLKRLKTIGQQKVDFDIYYKMANYSKAGGNK